MAGLSRFLTIALALALLPATARSQTPSSSPAPATPDQLAQIAARGRALEAYDQAAWHGSDAAEAIAKGDTFATVYEAVSTDDVHFTARHFSPPREDTGFLVAAAHAIKTAEAKFQFVRGFRYNVAALPNADGTMYVYLYPAQTQPRIFPIGGDGRYTFSTDGLTVLDEHRMHNSVLAVDASAGVPAGDHVAAGFHTDVVENVPQDTDVFHVLARTPAIPDYVSARGFLYKIDIDGTVEYLTTKPPGVP